MRDLHSERCGKVLVQVPDGYHIKRNTKGEAYGDLVFGTLNSVYIARDRRFHEFDSKPKEYFDSNGLPLSHLFL
jgi:hypothetical protein